MSLTSIVSSQINASLVRSPDLGADSASIADKQVINFDNGTGADQANVLYVDTRTLAASANETLDLTALTDPATGAAIVFTAIKAIRITTDAGNTNDVIIGAAAATVFNGPLAGTTPTIQFGPGNQFLATARAAAGWVVDGTHKSLKFANSGGTTGVTYTIVLIGK